MGIKRLVFTFLCLSLFTGTKLSAQFSKGDYRIALLLPFHTSGYKGSLGEAMLDYYTGFRAAAEDLESEGLNLRLYVYDSEKDSNALEYALEHPDMKKMDVIVGPVYDKEMAVVEAFCKQHGIIPVSPLKFCKPQVPNSGLINFFVPDSTKQQAVADLAARYYPGYRFYIAQDNSAKSKACAAIMKAELNRLKIRNVKTLIYTGAAIGQTALYKDSVVIISAVESKGAREPLSKAISTKKHACLFAHPEWHSATMSTVGIDDPKMIWPEVNYVNPADSLAAGFRSRFIEKHFIEPSKYAYIGYDQASYLSYSLMQYGRDFINHLPGADYRGFICTIRLSSGPLSIINYGMNLLQVVEEERIEFKP